MSSRRGLCVLVAALLGALLTGCASLPEAGPVHVARRPGTSASAAPFDFAPPGPVRGSSPEQIVAGFLGALQATPVSTRVATQFLTRDAAAGWHPEQRTVVYATQQMRSHAGRVTVKVHHAFSLDRNGHYEGPVGARGGLRFRLVRSEGEWRIARLPDATIIPVSHFVTRYREYTLFFFDPTGRVLVPEPVYLPWGIQAPTQLVTALLAGPAGPARLSQRSFFPRGTRLGVSVPVGSDGVAEVPLSDEMRGLDPATLDRVMAQLGWTLRQEGGITRIRVTADGAPVQVPAGRNSVDVDGWGHYSPVLASASRHLFGVRGRHVVEIAGGSESAVASLPGRGFSGAPRSLGVSISGAHFALVSPDGREVEVLDRSAANPSQPSASYGGHDLLQPMWDRTDRLWLVDRRPGATVRVVDRGRARRIAAPGLDGRRVLAATLSRDGTRLAAVVGTAHAARLLLLGVVRGQGGSPVRLTAAKHVATPQSLERVRAIGWRTPTTLAVLTRPSATTSEVVLATVDGSSGHVVLEGTPDVLFDAGTAMATSPGNPTSLVVVTKEGPLFTLDPEGQWSVEAVASGLGAPAYVG